MDFPKSLTAIVHVNFHYQDGRKPVTQSQIETMSKILEHVSEFHPKDKAILVKFIDYLSTQKKKNSQSSS